MWTLQDTLGTRWGVLGKSDGWIVVKVTILGAALPR